MFISRKIILLSRKLVLIGCISISLVFPSCAKKGEKWTVYSNIGTVLCIASTPGYMWFGGTGGLLKWNIEDKTYKKFTTIDGLGSNTIYFIHPDSSGNLWMGGKYHITKYDGKNFKGFTFKDILGEKWEDYRGKQRQGSVWLTGHDKDGTLWFSVIGGISTFNGQKWIHRDISSTLPPEYRKSGLGWGGFILDSKNRLWGGSRGKGVYVIDSEKITFFTEENGFIDKFPLNISEDSKGNIWVASRTNGVSRFDGEKWVNFNTEDGLLSNWVIGIGEDKYGNIYVGGERGTCWYDEKVWSKLDLWISGGGIDRNGDLWFATEKGIGLWDGEWKEFLDFHPDDPLTDNWVSSGDIGKEGKLWFGTGSGVCVFDGVQWQKYPLLKDRVDDILVLDSGEVWTAMRGGVGKFSNGEWKIFTTRDGLAHSHATSIARDLNGYLWFGTANGLSRFDGKEWKTYTILDGLAGNIVLSLAIDSEEKLWCGTNGGISTFDGTKWKSFTEKDGVPAEMVTYITFDSKGTLWFASWGVGLGSFDGKEWKMITMEDGLPDHFIYSITADDEARIWVASENAGVWVFKDDKRRTLTPKDGLATYYVRKVLIDKKGAVWFSTEAGISKLEGFKFH